MLDGLWGVCDVDVEKVRFAKVVFLEGDEGSPCGVWIVEVLPWCKSMGYFVCFLQGLQVECTIKELG